MLPTCSALLLFLAGTAAAVQEQTPEPLPAGAVARLGSAPFKVRIAIKCLAVSPDGRTLAVGPGEAAGGKWHPLGLFDTATGKEQLTLQGDRGLTRAMAFSPDGKLLASVSHDRIFSLWDSATGKRLQRLVGHHGHVTAVAFSPDGLTLVSSSMDKTLRLWNAATGEPLATLEGHDAPVWSLAWSSDGKRIISGGGDQTIRIWDAVGQRELVRVDSDQGTPRLLLLSGDGQFLLSSSFGSLRLWKTTPDLQAVVTLRMEALVAVAMSPDGRCFATQESGGGLRLWETCSGKELLRIGDGKVVASALAFSPDGTKLITGDTAGALRIWDTSLGRELARPDGHLDRITTLAFSGDGRTLASGSDDGGIRVWNASGGTATQEWRGEESPVRALVFSRDRKTLYSSGPGNAIGAWDPRTGKERERLVGHQATVNCLAISPDGRTLASGSNCEEYPLRFWELPEGRHVVQSGSELNSVAALAFAGDGKKIACGTVDQGFRLSNVITGQQLVDSSPRPTGEGQQSIAFSPDGRTFARGHITSIGLFSAATGEKLRNLPGGARSLAFSEDGRFLASADANGRIHLWDATTGAKLLQLPGHSEGVTALAFAPGGRLLASGSWDTTILVWDLAATRRASTKSVETLWTDLIADDASVAYETFLALVAAGNVALPTLRRLLTEVEKDETRVEGLLRELDDEDPLNREKASTELKKVGLSAVPMIRKSLDQASEEVRGRAKDILDFIQSGLPLRGDFARRARALQVLEWIGSPAARNILKELASDAPLERERREAAAALERLP